MLDQILIILAKFGVVQVRYVRYTEAVKALRQIGALNGKFRDLDCKIAPDNPTDKCR